MVLMKESGPVWNKLTRLTQKLGKFKYPVLILLLGVLLLLLPRQKQQPAAPEETTAPVEAQSSLGVEETRLANLLSRIQGAGAVEVMLSLKSGEQVQYQTDTQRQTDSGGTEESLRQEDNTVLYATGSGSQSALVQQVTAPTYQGAIVVCQGADDPAVKLALVQAVASVTGLGADQITVVIMKCIEEENFMKNWKKNAVVASILVFVCAGIYLNWLYTQDTETADLVDTLDQEKILGSSTLVMSQNDDLAADAAKEDLSDVSGEVTDYFAAVRLSRQESRDSAVSMLQEAMSYGEDAQSTSASQELEGLVETALCEAQIESLVIAKGYTDCVAYMSDGGISVAVAAPEEGLQEADVALITDIVMTQADLDLADIRIVEVK